MRTALQIAILSLLVSAGELSSAEKDGEKRDWIDSFEYNPRQKFDPMELRSLADFQDRDHDDRRRLLWLILRAGVEKDVKFRDLPGRADLRKNPEFDLALSAYEYSVNGDAKALERLLAEDEKLKRGGDYSTVQVFGFVDEWDRTIEAIRQHSAFADGAGGLAMSYFWAYRGELFPEHFAAYQKRMSNPDSFVQELAATVLDDPRRDYDYGIATRYFDLPEDRPYAQVRFWVKRLPRADAPPLVFVHTKETRSGLLTGHVHILERAGGKWSDVTKDVLPEGLDRRLHFRPRRGEAVIEVAPYELVPNKSGRGSHIGQGARLHDLVWQDGAFRTREPDGSKPTRTSREPLVPVE